MNQFDYDYMTLVNDIMTNGVDNENKRTNTVCRTSYHHILEYRELPILSLRRINWKGAIAELLGYLKGYTSAADFRKLGTRTWDLNANAEAWQKSVYCSGKDDMGFVYGYQMRNWGDIIKIDQLEKVINNLRNGIDDRGEILSMWNVSDLDRGCLRPCMYEHHFSLDSNGGLYLMSKQRSADVGLGLPYNSIQVWTFLQLMAQLTGTTPVKATHVIANAHIYDNQLDAMIELMNREPVEHNAKLSINPEIKTLNDIDTLCDTSDFNITDYYSGEPMRIPFTV